MLLALSTLVLFLCSAYCLADLVFYIGFKARLRPSHLTLGIRSVTDSSLPHLLFFALCLPLLWFFPLIALFLVFFAKRPHPLLTAWNDLKTSKLHASFPVSQAPREGDKFFSFDTSDKPHIIFLSLESFRAKNVGCLGAKEGLSPYFDKLAKEGILFSNFHAAGNFTSRAILATLFGVLPAQKPLHLGSYCKTRLIGLPQILKNHGYKPALIQGASLSFDHEAEFFEAQGFETIWGRKELKSPSSSWGVFDEHLMTKAAQWLSEQKDPAFLNIYTITNHHPWIHPHKKPGYFHTFSYTDEALGIFIENLKQKKLLEKCIFFIFGDHGQTVKEGIPPFQINQDLYQENIHVPLLIYAPGRISEPKIINTVASQIDLLPTVVDLMGFQDPHHSLGKSLLRPSSAPIYFNHPFDRPCIGCREGDWKYLLYEEGEELYNLKLDPDEKERCALDPIGFREKTKAYFAQIDAFYSGKLQQKVETCRSLNFGNSMKMDDAMLLDVAKKHPELSVLSLNDCLLLTNQGIAQLLRQCPKIEKLYINGLDEITGENWESAPELVQLHALNCPKMKMDWVTKLANLRVLKLGSWDICDEDLIALGKTHQKLEKLHLSNLKKITDKGLSYLLQANPLLTLLVLDHMPLLTPNPLRNSPHLSLVISDCPGLPASFLSAKDSLHR